MVTQGGAPLTGLVLSGGGARGAYEAGIIRYIREELPQRVKARARFEIICGTSVGAINCCYLAASNHDPASQSKLLTDIWERLRIEDVYKVGWSEVRRLPRFLLGSKGRGSLDDIVGPGRLGGLLNTAPLEDLMKRTLEWDKVHENISSGNLKALAINATHLESGMTHVFVEQQASQLPPWSTDPHILAVPVQIGPEHALASAAMPWLFPAVEIDGQVYYDGGLKLNTPISPALRLGADRLLVIGLRSEDNVRSAASNPVSNIESYPSAMYLLGKILNALLTDKTDYDLMRLERFNAIIEELDRENNSAVSKAFSEIMIHLRGSPYRKIETLVIRPSQNLATLAAAQLKLGKISARVGGLLGMLLNRLSEASEGQTADLLSFLLFDGDYGRQLIQLGMQDADAVRQQLIDFFSV